MDEKYKKALEKVEAAQASYEESALKLALGEYAYWALLEKGEMSLSDLSEWVSSTPLSKGKMKALENFLSKIKSTDSVNKLNQKSSDS